MTVEVRQFPLNTRKHFQLGFIASSEQRLHFCTGYRLTQDAADPSKCCMFDRNHETGPRRQISDGKESRRRRRSSKRRYAVNLLEPSNNNVQSEWSIQSNSSWHENMKSVCIYRCIQNVLTHRSAQSVSRLWKQTLKEKGLNVVQGKKQLFISIQPIFVSVHDLMFEFTHSSVADGISLTSPH